MGEEGEGVGPLKPEYIRLIKIAIVAVIVIVALVIAIPFVQEALRQPRVTLIESSESLIRCETFNHFHSTGFFSGFDHLHIDPPQVYTGSFTLVNSGDADGFANVQLHLDGINMANENYFIPAGTSIQKSLSLQIDSCTVRAPDIVLAAFWKA